MTASTGHGVPRLLLLGGASLSARGATARLEKKTAALVAYLSLEGPTGRSRLAGLLWPESREATARNNLAQAVRRLKTAAGAALIEGDATLALAGASSDVGDLLRLAQAGDFAEAAALEGELLAGYDLDDCPDIDGWLRSARLRVARAWTRAAEAELARCESAGALDDAVAWAERLVRADPVSEAAHLRATRLWLARGDAPAAMRAYERCRQTLARELGMKPSAAMVEVFRTIREGAPAPKVGAASLPAQVLRPKWVGRAAELEVLARAGTARQTVVVEGEPGVGKSRLVRDFAAGAGVSFVIEGRPGDADVPFSTLSRALRVVLTAPGLTLGDWARAELARLVPDLFDDDAAGVTSTRSKLRFFEAVAHAFGAAAKGAPASLVADDMQWFDSASAEVVAWIAAGAARSDLLLRVLVAHRTAELPPEMVASLERAYDAGTAVRVALGPLSGQETEELVASLSVPGVEGRLEAVAAASRGIPLYALEIVRSIAESAASPSSGDASAVAVPDRVRSLLQRRLERLGEAALRVARVMAVAGPEFDLELAAHVLQKDPLDLADPLVELERAQIAIGSRLSHDLLAETVREALPAAVRAHIHARTAEHLARAGADPARVGQHLEAGGRPAEAAPLYVRAAMAARGLSRITDAIALFDRAARLFEACGNPQGASEALYLRSRTHMGSDADDVVTRLERIAQTDRDRARALCTHANVALERGRLEEARRVAREAHPLACAAGDVLVEAESLQAWLDAELRTGRVAEAEQAFGLFREASSRMADDPEAVAAVLYYEAELFLLRDLPTEAIATFDKTLALLDRWGQLRHSKAGILALMARALLAVGEVDRAEAAVREASAILAEATGANQSEAHVALARAGVLRARGLPAQALAALASIAAPMHELRMELAARELAAEIRLEQGDASAWAELGRIAADGRADARTRIAAERAKCSNLQDDQAVVSGSRPGSSSSHPR